MKNAKLKGVMIPVVYH